MKLALIQSNPTVGAIADNVAGVLDALARAERGGADVALTSELALVGYPPRDLLDRPAFVDQIARANADLVRRVGRVALVFGTVDRLPDGRLANQAVVAHQGIELGRATKQLLPTYDVFDERRYFAAGSALCRVELVGMQCVVTICEDAWAREPELQRWYDRDPLNPAALAGAEVHFNLSASPFTLTKMRRRPQLFSDLARETRLPTAMVNQVGANDELIFDGQSAVWSPTGAVLARARGFQEDLLVADLAGASRIEAEPTTEEQAAYEALVVGVRDYARKCGFSHGVLGLSGGLDSALVACVAVDALGPENVLGVAMPTRYSSQGSRDDAASLAANLGMKFQVIDVDPIFAAYEQTLGAPLDELGAAGANDVTWENVQARIRGATVMAISNRTGALPLTTGNKSELAVGYCTLYGDMVGGLSVISDVPKTMVYRIARWLNGPGGSTGRGNAGGERIPTNSIAKPPSAELRPDQKDEDSLPPYEVLDPILFKYVEEHLSTEQIVASGEDPDLVKRIVGLVVKAEYKRRQAAPGLIITRKAFGSGRRVPIAQGHAESHS